jgi:tetratricopeptide (TPR) repeat protein
VRRSPIVLILALALGVLTLSGCSRTDEDPLQAAASTISEIADPGQRAAAARAFLAEHPAADPTILGGVASDFLYALSQHRGPEVAIAAADSMTAVGLPDYVRASVEGYLATELLGIGTPDNMARAEAISRRLLDEDIDHPYAYTFLASQWLRALGDENKNVGPWLPLDLALKGSEKAEEGWTEYADMVLGRAYGAVFERVEERGGHQAILAIADSLLALTKSPDGAAHIRRALYDATVEDDPEAAVAIAEAVEASMNRMTGGDVLNSIAYDLAERDLAPGLAVSLAERALELAKSKWDSVYILDTVGWAQHKAGDDPLAAAALNRALDLAGEDPTYGDETLQHLLAVYDTEGDLDGSIELLVRVAARSLDPDAVDALRQKLIARDGNADNLDRLLTENRYAGIEPAPAFALPDRSGEVVALDDLRGRVSLVCFWSYG